ncbi:MAG: DUF421 domain-containing protein [Bacillota bacterium]
MPVAASMLEVFMQTVLAFTAILVYARILGKQQIGQLTFFEYITGITFGSIAATLATDIGPTRTAMHFLGLTVFAALTYLLGLISLNNRPARKVIGGEPTVVVHNGKVLESNMRKMRYNLDELQMQLREKGFFRMSDVEFALLEPNGSLSVLPKSQLRPVTPKDLQISTEYEGLSTEMVIDGKIIHQNLDQLGLNKEWLMQQLSQMGVTDIKQVAYASLGTNGKLYIDLVKDDLQTPVDISDWPKPPK